jgi:hypothetical protein
MAAMSDDHAKEHVEKSKRDGIIPLVMAVLDTAIQKNRSISMPFWIAGPEPGHDERERFRFFHMLQGEGPHSLDGN